MILNFIKCQALLCILNKHLKVINCKLSCRKANKIKFKIYISCKYPRYFHSMSGKSLTTETRLVIKNYKLFPLKQSNF